MLGNFFFFLVCVTSAICLSILWHVNIFNVSVQRTLIGLCSISCSPYADIYSTSLYEDNTNYYPCCIVGFDFLSTGGLQIVACKVLLSRLENTKGLDGMWVLSHCWFWCLKEAISLVKHLGHHFKYSSLLLVSFCIDSYYTLSSF